MYSSQHYTATPEDAAADSIKAGFDTNFESHHIGCYILFFGFYLYEFNFL